MKESDNKPLRLPLTTDAFAATCAMLMLRIWLGVRCLQAGIEKYAGINYVAVPTIVNGEPDPNKTESVLELKYYAFDNYQGVPGSLKGKLLNEPLITEWFLTVYEKSLGPLLLIVGLCVLIGFATRVSLLAMGLIYTSLTYGLILLNQAAGIAWLGTHIILITFALLLASYNRLELSQLLAVCTGIKWLRNK